MTYTRCCAVALIVGFACPSAFAAEYQVIQLGTLDGFDVRSEAFSLNGSGTVVGVCVSDTMHRAFVWDAMNGMRSLPGYPGASGASSAWSINAAGQIAGDGEISASSVHGLIWSNEITSPIDTGDIPGDASTSGMFATNDMGQAVGAGLGPQGTRAVIWDAVNGIQDLGDLPGGDDRATAYDINSQGRSVGFASGVTGTRAVMWDPVNGIQNLGSMPGTIDYSEAYAINNASQVVGMNMTQWPLTRNAFIWDEATGMHSLGDLPGGDGFGAALDINNPGQVVGYARVQGWDRAFIWDIEHGMRDLTQLSDAPLLGITISRAQQINDSGWIVGTAIDAQGRQRAVLLVPSPGTAAFLCAIGVSTFSRRRRNEARSTASVV